MQAEGVVFLGDLPLDDRSWWRKSKREWWDLRLAIVFYDWKGPISLKICILKCFLPCGGCRYNWKENWVNWITGSRQVITLGEMEGVRAKAKFQRKLTARALLTFLPTYSLHNRLVNLLNFNWKNSETTRWTITCSQLIVLFLSLWSKKNKCSLFFMVSYCNEELRI